MRLQNDQDGATIWEFALVLPLLILFTLGLMDFSRYLTARAILNSSANRAVSLAAVVEDLDTDCRFLPDGDQSACGSRRESAITSVLTTARQMPLRTMIGDKAANSSMYFVGGDDTVPAVELMLGASDIRAYYKKGDTADPKYSFDAELPNGPSLTAELRERPIEVTLRAEVRPYLWFLGPLQVSGFASGFRERRSAPSFPKRIDCVNDAVAAGEEGTTVCPCKDYPDDGSKVESEEGVCSCREGLIYVEQPDGSFTCECPGDNFLMPDNSGRCTNCQFATAEEASCGENQIFDQNNCACIDCPNQEMANEEGTSCSCPANFITENECTGEKQIVDLLNCKCFNCPGATVANDQHTTCVCQADCDPNAGEYLNASQCRCESCAPPKVVKNNNCVCDVECAENEVIDYVNCRCTPCPPRTTKVGNSCVCEAWGTCNEQTEILNLSECRCDACPPDHVPVWGLW